jgi:hypothetical protein
MIDFRDATSLVIVVSRRPKKYSSALTFSRRKCTTVYGVGKKRLDNKGSNSFFRERWLSSLYETTKGIKRKLIVCLILELALM